MLPGGPDSWKQETLKSQAGGEEIQYDWGKWEGQRQSKIYGLQKDAVQKTLTRGRDYLRQELRYKRQRKYNRKLL